MKSCGSFRKTRFSSATATWNVTALQHRVHEWSFTVMLTTVFHGLVQSFCSIIPLRAALQARNQKWYMCLWLDSWTQKKCNFSNYRPRAGWLTAWIKTHTSKFIVQYRVPIKERQCNLQHRDVVYKSTFSCGDTLILSATSTANSNDFRKLRHMPTLRMTMDIPFFNNNKPSPPLMIAATWRFSNCL